MDTPLDSDAASLEVTGNRTSHISCVLIVRILKNEHVLLILYLQRIRTRTYLQGNSVLLCESMLKVLYVVISPHVSHYHTCVSGV